MASRKYLVSIDFNKNQLIQACLHNSSPQPTSPNPGQMYFDTDDNKPYVYNGTAWVDFGSSGGSGDISDGIGIDIDSSGATDVINADPDLITINFTGTGTDPADKLQIKDLGVSTGKIADSAVTFAKMQDISSKVLIGNMNAASGTPEEVSTTNVITSPGDDHTFATTKSIVDYVSGIVTAIGEFQTNWDASGGTFPTTEDPEGTGDQIQKGDYWVISVAGTMGTSNTISVNVGDVLYAKTTDTGTTDYQDGSNWFVTETNRDQATETVMGVAKLATEVEVKSLSSSSDNTHIITPLRLYQALVQQYYEQGITKMHTQTITGDGSQTAFPVTHGFNTRAVTIEMYDSSYETVEAGFTRTDVNYITVTFNTAPGSGVSYTVMVTGVDNS